MSKDAHWTERLSGTAPQGGVRSPDRPWQAHLYPQSERVAAAARVPIVLATVGWWLLAMHGRPAVTPVWNVPILAVSALALAWALGMAAVVYRRPSLFERMPALSVAADLALVGIWLIAVGKPHDAAFLPVLFLGAASGATRTPLASGMLFSLAFGALAVVFGGGQGVLIALYTVILGVALSVFAAAVHQDRLHSLRDPLTGVYSRRYGLYQLHQLVRTQQVPFCVGLLDLDSFKAINDRYGHPIGDQVLASIASIVQNSLRQGDDVVRMGGDEFMLILPSTGLDGARLVAERVLELLAAARVAASGSAQPVETTASIGLVEVTEGLAVPYIIERADACLYAAKRKRNAIVAEAAG